MKKILISWVGEKDLKAVSKDPSGPVYAAIRDAEKKRTGFKAVYLLCNYPVEKSKTYEKWLKKKLPTDTTFTFTTIKLKSPTSYKEIYPAAFKHLSHVEQHFPDYQKYIHLSPGTPSMIATWLLLVKTHFPAVCIESWVESNIQHVQEQELPFKIDARFTEAYKNADKRLEKIESQDIELSEIIGSHQTIKIAKKKAILVAKREVPVLILGETGTGKELFARAIHENSIRNNQPFIAVNCSALPDSLAESHLFGHVKGAFTGAVSDHKGYFEKAHSGTLFLDEIGELKPDLQAKLLRVLQEKEFLPVGAEEPQKSDFRLISATNRDLIQMIDNETFREDLFYRLAIGLIKLPPLRERGSDITLLCKKLMNIVNDELADQPNYIHKKLTHDAINYISMRDWPGNIRELRASLLRAAIWSETNQLTRDDMVSSIIDRKTKNQLLPDSLDQDVDLNHIIMDFHSDN